MVRNSDGVYKTRGGTCHSFYSWLGYIRGQWREPKAHSRCLQFVRSHKYAHIHTEVSVKSGFVMTTWRTINNTRMHVLTCRVCCAVFQPISNELVKLLCCFSSDRYNNLIVLKDNPTSAFLAANIQLLPFGSRVMFSTGLPKPLSALESDK